MKEFNNILELDEDSNYILEFLNQKGMKVKDIEIILSLLFTKFLLIAKENFADDGYSGDKLELMMSEYKFRLFSLFEKNYILFEKLRT